MSKIIIITLVLAILFLCSTLIIDFFYQIYINIFTFGWFRGETTKEKIVEKYIEGLKAENSEIIKKLVPRSYNADKAIQDKIEKFREADFSKIEICFGKEPSPLDIEIKNIKLKNGKSISDKICVEQDCHQYSGIIKCNKWHLLMGKIEEKYRPIPTITNSLPSIQR